TESMAMAKSWDCTRPDSRDCTAVWHWWATTWSASSTGHRRRDRCASGCPTTDTCSDCRPVLPSVHLRSGRQDCCCGFPDRTVSRCRVVAAWADGTSLLAARLDDWAS